MNCDTCSKHPEPVPYIVFESATARLERTIRRLWITLLTTIVLLVASNAVWIYYESQFADEVTTIEQDSENGYNSYIGHDGDIYNGEAEDNDKETDTEDGR